MRSKSDGSSRPETLCKKGVLRNYKIHRKTPAPEPKACNFITKETLVQVFSCGFCEISQNPFSYRTHPAADPDQRRI